VVRPTSGRTPRSRAGVIVVALQTRWAMFHTKSSFRLCDVSAEGCFWGWRGRKMNEGLLHDALL